MANYILVHGIRIAKDFVPETFGKLTTVGPKFLMPQKNGFRTPHQVCVCECGNFKVASTPQMKAGHTKSCGCLQAKTEKPRNRRQPSPEQECLYAMRKRCYNPSHRSYKNYGGRGIKVCDRWMGKHGVKNFLEDMGRRPGKGYSIDRIDNNGDYCPENCRWEKDLKQNRNRRNCNMISYNGKTQNASAWAEAYGIPRLTFDRRLRAGWPIEKALTTPVKGRNPDG